MAPAEGEGAPESGKPNAEKLFRTYARFVWRVLRHLGVREADLEDVCQEVFITVHRRLPTFEGRSSPRTWVYGIALRAASDHRRRAHVRREVPGLELPERAADGGSPLEAAVRRQELGRLDRALAGLDADKRVVFVLYEIEELSMKDVAEIVGCPLQTAYSRLHAARKLLLACFELPSGREGP